MFGDCSLNPSAMITPCECLLSKFGMISTGRLPLHEDVLVGPGFQIGNTCALPLFAVQEFQKHHHFASAKVTYFSRNFGEILRRHFPPMEVQELQLKGF